MCSCKLQRRQYPSCNLREGQGLCFAVDGASGGLPEGPRKSPRRLIADRGYSYPICRGLLRRCSIRRLSRQASGPLGLASCFSSSLKHSGRRYYGPNVKNVAPPAALLSRQDQTAPIKRYSGWQCRHHISWSLPRAFFNLFNLIRALPPSEGRPRTARYESWPRLSMSSPTSC